MTVTQKFLKSFGAIFGANVLRMLSQGALILILTRYLLSPAEYGLLFFTMSVLGIATMLTRLGLDKSAARFISEYQATDPGQIRHVLQVSIGLLLITTALISILLAVFNKRIAQLLNEPGIAPLLLVGIGYVVGRTFISYSVTSFQGLNSVSYSALVRSVYSVATPVLVIPFFTLRWGLVGVMLGYVGSALLTAVLGLGVLFGKFYRSFTPPNSPADGLTSRVFRYSLPLSATRAANVLYRRVDMLLIGYFVNPTAVGLYTLAKQISQFIMAPASSLGFTVSPKFGQQKANGDLDEAARIYETTLEYVLLLYVPAATGLVIIAHPLVRFVFGSTYVGAAPVIQIFSLYVLIQSINNLTNDSLDFLGRANARAAVKGATSVANFGLNLVLIPRYGVIGASVATVVTFAIMVTFELYIITNELPLRLKYIIKSFLRTCTLTAVMGAFVFVLTQYISGIVTLLTVVGIGVILWIALAMLSGAVDVEKLTSTLT